MIVVVVVMVMVMVTVRTTSWTTPCILCTQEAVVQREGPERHPRAHLVPSQMRCLPSEFVAVMLVAIVMVIVMLVGMGIAGAGAGMGVGTLAL